MTIWMKALRDFRGQAGEGFGGGRMIEAGDGMPVTSQARADELERRGLAVPLADRRKAEPMPQNKMEPVPQNKAADAGPLPSDGGQTGGENSSLSPPGGPRRKPSSLKKPAAKRG